MWKKALCRFRWPVTRHLPGLMVMSELVVGLEAFSPSACCSQWLVMFLTGWRVCGNVQVGQLRFSQWLSRSHTPLSYETSVISCTLGTSSLASWLDRQRKAGWDQHTMNGFDIDFLLRVSLVWCRQSTYVCWHCIAEYELGSYAVQMLPETWQFLLSIFF